MSDPNSPRPDSPQSLADKIKEAALQADTVTRSAANIATFSMADKAEAGWDALFDQSPGDWLAHYKTSLQNQLNRNFYDANHRQAATAAGGALGAGLLTALGYRYGAGLSGALSILEKGKLGEDLSKVKTMLQGDWPVASQVRKPLPNGRSTVLDHETAGGRYVEAKFGPRADLSRNQRIAQQIWSRNYRVDRWLPWHVGVMTAPAGTVGGLLSWGTQQPFPWDGDAGQNMPGN